ncbi:MAG: radical SAM protein [Bacteroidales bacterium]|nr:radical SAM protein [Bacteroidales bacterium]
MSNDQQSSSFGKARMDKRKLESIFLFVTGKCNSKCAMCFYANDMAKKENDLTFDEIRKISESAGHFNRLWLSGGEPTLREDLPEILEMFYKNNHITDVNMPTNGLKPDRVIEWISRFRKNCPDANIVISLSFDGFGEVHDRQRGVPGNFYKALETLHKIDAAFNGDPKVIKNISTVITKFNIDQINDFMRWIFGRFNTSSHIIEAARGETREDGVKILTEATLRIIQDAASPYYCGYAERFVKDMSGFKKMMARNMYLGTYRNFYNIRAKNIDGPTPWGMDCTAGETTLVIDYDGRFRACELREPIGKVQDYDCDIQKIMFGDAMKKEIEAIGHGAKANCWCTHGCWIMSSMVFNPVKMIFNSMKGSKEMKKLNHPIDISDTALRALEEKYQLDSNKLKEIGII